MRSGADLGTPFIGLGYREDTGGWVDPTKFIEAHRGAPDDDVGRDGPIRSVVIKLRCNPNRSGSS